MRMLFRDFGRPVALRGRETLSPVHYTPYFQLHGGLYRHQTTQSFNALLLILSQTRTITTSERNWSMNECIHSRNKNRLEQDILTDLTFVHCNLVPSTEAISGIRKQGDHKR